MGPKKARPKSIAELRADGWQTGDDVAKELSDCKTREEYNAWWAERGVPVSEADE